MNSSGSGQLPMFPHPYPGESFYSVLCRYHQRSCNKTSGYTMNQLFGKSRRISSTLLTPFRLYEVSHWVSPGSTITPAGMLMKNTAFPLIKISIPDLMIQEHSQVAVSGKSARASSERSYISISRYQRTVLNTSRALRYCPECARIQKKLYGETYWQVLPQVQGVEYCPEHKCPIIATRVTIDDIHHIFYPASDIISAGMEKRVVFDEWQRLALHNKDFFIHLSEGIEWIFNNPQNTGNVRTLCRGYRATAGLKHPYDCYLWPFTKLEQRIRLSVPAELADYVIQDNSKYLSEGWDNNLGQHLALYKIPFGLHVMNMACITDSPESFYRTAV